MNKPKGLERESATGAVLEEAINNLLTVWEDRELARPYRRYTKNDFREAMAKLELAFLCAEPRALKGKGASQAAGPWADRDEVAPESPAKEQPREVVAMVKEWASKEARQIAHFWGAPHFDLADHLEQHAHALIEKLGQGWIPVSEGQAPPHAKYLVRRDGMIFTATPCYGMHNPWWVVRTLTGEAEPAETRQTDEWMSLPPPPERP